jgi:type IV secretory pathway TraG/TraD family ATPase VirD4
MIDKNAHGQRSGVLASLVMISDALKLLPAADGRPKFSFTEWSRNGSSSLFLGTKGVGEREGLRPILSAWLDTGFFRLMEQKGGTPTWCFVDELPSLQKLPSLKTALHEGRKYNMRFVLGFQGRAQIEQLYGRDAETLMSAPSTRIFLRSNEYAAADWAAKNIGMPEREREVESFTSPLSFTGSGKESVNVRTDKRTDYLVYPNEIQNLPKLSGYLRYDRYAVPIQFDYPTLKK